MKYLYKEILKNVEYKPCEGGRYGCVHLVRHPELANGEWVQDDDSSMSTHLDSERVYLCREKLIEEKRMKGTSGFIDVPVTCFSAGGWKIIDLLDDKMTEYIDDLDGEEWHIELARLAEKYEHLLVSQ